MARTKAKTTKTKQPKKTAPTQKLTQLSAEVKTTLTAAQRRAEELISLIQRRKATITESFYEIGQALKELLKKKLYAAIGYASFDELLTARDLFGASQAYKLIEVVSSVPLKTAIEFGPEKVFALTRYAAATPEPDTAQSLVESNATIGDKPVRQASLRDITKATGGVKAEVAKKQGKKADPAEREANQAMKQGKTWLKARGVKQAELSTRKTKEGYRIRVQIELTTAEALSLFNNK